MNASQQKKAAAAAGAAVVGTSILKRSRLARPAGRRRDRRGRLHPRASGREPQWHDVESRSRPNEHRSRRRRGPPRTARGGRQHRPLGAGHRCHRRARAAGRRGADRLRGGAGRPGAPTRRRRRGRSRHRPGRAPPRRRAAPGRDRAPAPGRAARPHRRRSRPSCRAAFSGHRAVVGGREVTDNEIAAILLRSTDVAERREAWLASAASATSSPTTCSSSIAPAQRGRPGARAPRPLRVLARHGGARRGLAVRPPRRPGARPEPALDGREGRHRRRRARPPRPARRRGRCSRGTTPTRSSRSRRRRPTTRCSTPSPASTRSPPPARYFATSATTSTPILARSDLEPRPRQGPARLPDHGRPRLRHPHALQPRADAALARDAAARARARDLRRQRRQVAAVAAAHALAHFTTEAVAMLHGRRARDHVFLERFAGIAPDVARAPRQQRRRPPRPAHLRGRGCR